MTSVRSEAVRLVHAQPADAVVHAATDILGALRDSWRLTVTESHSLRSRGARGWCDGMSITESGIVLYRPTGHRGSAFTLAHELGHALVENDDDCINWLSTQPDLERALEQVCDAVAAELLIPPGLREAAFDNAAPSAATLGRLYELTQASWSACAVALASRLPCDGFVAIVNADTQTVFFAARARDTRPYAWRDDVVPTGHTLRSLGAAAQLVSWWPRFNINERRRYYLSAERHDEWLHAVFVENDLWGVDAFHTNDDEGPARHEGTVECWSCGYKGATALFPCNTCRAPTCQRCHKCGCDRAEERQRVMCNGCFSFVQTQLIEDGLCPGCR